MSTRTELVAAAAQRLGETSDAFKALVDNEFPFVIRDMAGRQAIGLLTASVTVNLTASTRAYTVTTLLGISNEVWDIESIVAYDWGPTEGIISRAQSNYEFAQQRLTDGDTTEGRPTLWRFFPQRNTIEFHPVPDAEAASADIEISYIAEPTVPAAGASVAQIPVEFQEVVIWGLLARMAPFKEEYQAEAAQWWQLYLDGIERMKGWRFNSQPGRIEPREP